MTAIGGEVPLDNTWLSSAGIHREKARALEPLPSRPGLEAGMYQEEMDHEISQLS